METESDKKITAPGRGRTYDLLLRKQTLYPLSYRRRVGRLICHRLKSNAPPLARWCTDDYLQLTYYALDCVSHHRIDFTACVMNGY